LCRRDDDSFRDGADLERDGAEIAARAAGGDERRLRAEAVRGDADLEAARLGDGNRELTRAVGHGAGDDARAVGQHDDGAGNGAAVGIDDLAGVIGRDAGPRRGEEQSNQKS
jgi:hypothetical protein